MKLQLLIPQYKETESEIKPLLDSLSIQQSINFSEIGVIITNDGTDVHLSQPFLNSYPFQIDYYLAPHQGVSATRNYCLDRATADYVMFCDADDMFCHACGLYFIFKEIEKGFDVFLSIFVEESRDKSKNPIYINHEKDATFVHGKAYRRQFLIDNNIRWKEHLTIHEDSYFNYLCQACAGAG
jgi:glycosyltransferase involved in cell wall biosynthesis